MKHLILILLTALCCTCCSAQKDKETTTMKTTERFDVQYYKSKIKEVNGKDGDNSFAIYVDRDSTQVKVYFDKDYDALVTIPPFTYYKEVRIFHKNGILKKEGKRLFCSSVDIGIWRTYLAKTYANTWLIPLFYELLLTLSCFPVYIPLMLEPAQDVYRFQA